MISVAIHGIHKIYSVYFVKMLLYFVGLGVRWYSGSSERAGRRDVFGLSR